MENVICRKCAKKVNELTDGLCWVCWDTTCPNCDDEKSFHSQLCYTCSKNLLRGEDIRILNKNPLEKMENLLKKVLSLSKLKGHYMRVLLARVDDYYTVFKTKLYDSNDNLEIYEFLGDGIANAVIAWYFYRRFPQLRCSEGVKVLSRLRSIHASRKSFASIADKLGFWPFVKALQDEKRDKEKLLEDVFEAFIGLTVHILDEEFEEIGVGYNIVYEMLKTIFDELNISLEYEDLYDAKSRLKELYDANPFLGKIHYEQITATEVEVYRIVKDRERIFLGKGEGRTKPDREKEASERALETLRKEGIFRKNNTDLLCGNV